MAVKLRIQKNKSGRNSFYLDIHHKGRTKEFIPDLFVYDKPKTFDQKKFNIEVQAQAEKIRSDKELEIITGEHESLRKYRQDGDLIEYFEAFRDQYEALDINKVNGAINYLKEFGSVKFKSVDENFVEDYKEVLSRQLSAETARAYFSKFKKMLIRAHREKLCKFDIRVYSPRFEIGTETLKKEVLEESEIQLLANTPCDSESIKWAFLFSCFTGLDFADIYLLKWEHVKNGLKKPRSKTGVGRGFAMHPTAIAILSKFNKQTKWVFDGLPHRPKNIEEQSKRELKRHREYSQGAVNKTLKALVKRAGIDKHITYHCARHSYGTNLEGDDRTVSILLGHSEKSGSKMVAKYRRAKDERLKTSIHSLKSIDL